VVLDVAIRALKLEGKATTLEEDELLYRTTVKKIIKVWLLNNECLGPKNLG